MISAFRRLRRKTVVVHLTTNESLRGIMQATHFDAIVLSHVRHLDEKADLAGELVIPRDRVAFYQVEQP